MLSSGFALSVANIDKDICNYRERIADIGAGRGRQRGVELLSALKRDTVGADCTQTSACPKPPIG